MGAVGVKVVCPHRDKTGLSFNHTSYQGTKGKRPARRKCSYCGGELLAIPTVWAPVEFRKDGRYERPGVTYTSPEAAEAHAVGEQVVRSFSL